MEMVDQMQAVLIHRIGMVHVKLCAGDDPAKFQKIPPQNAAFIHDFQGGIGGFGFEQNPPEKRGVFRIATKYIVNQVQPKPKRGEGVRMNIEIASSGDLKQFENKRRFGL